MSILIVGADGSMGRRYQAILKYLDKPFKCIEKTTSSEEIIALSSKAEGVILATPTEQHFHQISFFSHAQIPILCEKPITKDLKELEKLGPLLNDKYLNLTMMMQYEHLVSPSSAGPSFYDYFRHGNDGLYWDCMQVIGLAKGRVDISENSPVWKCQINGQRLSIADMDMAYLSFVNRWLKVPGDDFKKLYDLHKKIIEYQNGQEH